MIAAVICLIVITLCDFIIPKPSNPLTEHKKQQNLLDARRANEAVKGQLKTAQAAVARYIWTEGMDQISSKSLDAVTTLAQVNKVQLLGFRPPQKTTDQDGLTHIPYLILLSGPFRNIQNFLSALEDPKYKLAEEMVQLSSADASTDNVSASISVIAYTLPAAATSSSSTSTVRSSKDQSRTAEKSVQTTTSPMKTTTKISLHSTTTGGKR